MTDQNRVASKLMYVNRRAPHGTIYAWEALEVVLMGAAFDQDVSVVFMDDGVYQIKSGQNSQSIGTKNFAAAYRALKMHDVEKLYVERESLESRGLKTEELMVPVEVLSSSEIGRLMADQDAIFNF